MQQPYYNDQAHIAEAFYLLEDHITQTAHLAAFKIQSYKLSLINAAFCRNKEELGLIIKSSLLNYTEPCVILAGLGFFDVEMDN